MRVFFVAGMLGLSAAIGGAIAAGDLRFHPIVCVVLLVVALASSASVVHGARSVPVRVAVVALACLRVVALVGGPTLSDDDNRYVHEGRAQRLGLSIPYATAPRDLVPPPPPDDGISARVNHPDVPAAYPPGVELVLLASTFVGDLVGHPKFPLRVLLVAADVFVLVALYRRRSSTNAFITYGSHPLPLLEIALGGHLDGFAIAALVAVALSSSSIAKGVLIGLAANVKPTALVALVSLRRREIPAALAACAIAAIVPAIPYVVDGAPLTRGIVEYGTRWRAAPFAFAIVEAPFLPLFEARAERGEYMHVHVAHDPFGFLVENAGTPIVAIGDARQVERKILVDAGFVARAISFLFLIVALAWIAKREWSADKKIAWAVFAFWMLAPTVHPWYVAWIVPFAAMTSSRPLLWFTAASPLLYEPVFRAADNGTWEERAWPRIVMIAAFVAGLLWEKRKRA